MPVFYDTANLTEYFKALECLIQEFSATIQFKASSAFVTQTVIKTVEISFNYKIQLVTFQ